MIQHESSDGKQTREHEGNGCVVWLSSCSSNSVIWWLPRHQSCSLVSETLHPSSTEKLQTVCTILVLMSCIRMPFLVVL